MTTPVHDEVEEEPMHMDALDLVRKDFETVVEPEPIAWAPASHALMKAEPTVRSAQVRTDCAAGPASLPSPVTVKWLRIGSDVACLHRHLMPCKQLAWAWWIVC